jgi:FkbM family methyltransferase
MSLRSVVRLLKSEVASILNCPHLYKKYYFSQEGEDIILEKIFADKKNGFYIDVGAHHPFRYSNTYLLHKKGWTGINIDPNPRTKRLFDRTRRKDINLEIAVDNISGEKIFYMFADDALNTLSKVMADTVVSSKQSILVNSTKVECKPLDHIFKKYVRGKSIDLLNIDVEGNEMNVLESNNWAYFKPKVIVIENLKKKNDINRFLTRLDYKLKAQTISSEIYVQK